MSIPSVSQFASMGSVCDVTVIGGSSIRLNALAQRRANDLEQRWSRFCPTSEISRINAQPMTATKVSEDTFLLVDHAVAAWRWTSGRFDPTVLRSMIANGYDRSFELLAGEPRQLSPSAAAPGCSSIVLDPASFEVTLGPRVGFDPGGIGKGLAADLIVDSLLEAGASGACVSMGGDIRVAGDSPDAGWSLGIANPFISGDLITVVGLQDHGLATSNRSMRKWSVDGLEFNHLVDPRNGRSVNGFVAASVITGAAWWSEALSKMAMVDGAASRQTFPLLGAEGLFVGADGSVTSTAGFENFDVTGRVVSRSSTAVTV